MLEFYIFILFLIVVLISSIFGNSLKSFLCLNEFIPSSLLGFLIWISSFFIISQFIDMANISSNEIFKYFLITTLVIIALSTRGLRYKYNSFDLILTVFYVTIMVFLSTRLTLGEQLGDNIYLFNLVTKNIDTNIINNFDFGTGLVYSQSAIHTAKESLTFYHFNSFILHYFYKVKELFSDQYVPVYVINMWLNNVLFFYFSATILISIKRVFNLKVFSYFMVFLFSGFFIGSYYYNLTLPHFGVTFLGLAVSMALILIYQYFKTQNNGYIIVLFLIFFAMNSMGSTGMLMAAYLTFGFIIVLIFNKDKNALLYASLLLTPIVLFANKVEELIKIPYLIIILAMLAVVLFILHYINPIKNFIYKYIIVFLVLLWLGIILISIKVVPNYFEMISSFGDPKENFDRVRDYFTFANPYQTLLNIFHYLLLFNVILNKKTRYLGYVLLLILIFFINPFSYPLLYTYTKFLYHRAYFVIFNITTLSIGLVTLLLNIKKIIPIFRLPIKVFLAVLVLFFTVENVRTYENVIYVPRDDFNPLYKLSNNQVEVLTVLHDEVDSKEIENPKVFSQIYGTLLVAPNVYHELFNVTNRRAWNPEKSENFSEIYKMMFTPVFEGDDGPRLEMNYWRLCHVLESEQPDYLLFDNSLTTLDDVSNNWLPIHWFARGCAVNIYENEGYTLYKYTGNTGANE